MIRVGILGSTGYAGAELVRLILGHGKAEIAFLDSRSYDGKEYIEGYPHLRTMIKKNCRAIDIEANEWLEEIDLLFCALPHGLSQGAVNKAFINGIKVIDLSADFRIKDDNIYQQWYQVKHQALEALQNSVYGLPEINRKAIKEAKIVANPGCYPTSIILPLYPLLKEGAVGINSIIADSKSGVSGAGRNPMDGSLFGQCNENLKAYGIGTHRHTPEIEEQLSNASGESINIQFTPHLVPMTRGILSTIYLDNSKGLRADDVKEIYQMYYGKEGFIRLLGEGEYPQTKGVSGSNLCDIAFKVDERTGRLILISVIDNLIKGAAGQAVQNMNILFNIEEDMGLKQMPLWP